MKKWHGELKDRIQRRRFLQEDVAQACGFNESYFSRALRGRVETADDFAEKVSATLDRMEQAERAADAARARVMAEAEG